MAAEGRWEKRENPPAAVTVSGLKWVLRGALVYKKEEKHYVAIEMSNLGQVWESDGDNVRRKGDGWEKGKGEVVVMGLYVWAWGEAKKYVGWKWDKGVEQGGEARVAEEEDGGLQWESAVEGGEEGSGTRNTATKKEKRSGDKEL